MASNLVDRDSLSEEGSSSNTTVRQRNRRGKGSKSKQAENFRAKKNVGFDNEMVRKIDQIKISFGYTPREIFGDRMLTSLVIPQIQLQIDTDCVGSICKLVTEILHNACKIPASSEAVESEMIEFDVDTLMWATALQLECKLEAARAGTQFLPHLDQEACFRTQRSRLLLRQALTPLAVVIDQIGRFSIGGQTFVPSVNNHRDFIYYRLADESNGCRDHFRCFQQVVNGTPTAFKNERGQRMNAIAEFDHFARLIELNIITVNGVFTADFLEAPHLFPYYGMVKFVPGNPPPAPLPVDEVARRYSELMGRVSKKLNQAFVEVDLVKGQGVESQLVFRRHTSESVYTAWSPRVIRPDSLEMGAILGLGYPSKMGDEEIAAITATIDVAAAFENLANVLTKRLR